MFTTNYIVGVLSSLILVIGAAWPVHKVSHPTHSVKNWLFMSGGLGMLMYSVLGYLEGGPIFFIILQVFVLFSSTLMMLDTSDKFDLPALSACGIAMIAWTLANYEGVNTIFFIVGLSGIAIGYALDTGTLQRNVALMLGSILIAVFSFIEMSWIFFWLNIFFAFFSGYHAVCLYRK